MEQEQYSIEELDDSIMSYTKTIELLEYQIMCLLKMKEEQLSKNKKKGRTKIGFNTDGKNET